MMHLQLFNAILWGSEKGCKWKVLPESYGNWHITYIRLNRLSIRSP